MNSATSQYRRVHGMVRHQALSVLTDLVVGATQIVYW